MSVAGEVKKEVDLSEVETDDLIEELEDRGHSVDLNLDSFTNEELCEYLGVPDLDPIDWSDLYRKICCGNGQQAFEEFKRIIEDKTGRIIV